MPNRLSIASTPNETTTFIGRWSEVVDRQERGLQTLAKELSKTTDLNVYMLTGKFDHPGGFNMLSIDNWSKIKLELEAKGIKEGTKAFDDFIWETYNRPWLESALQRGDNIVIWSNPLNQINLLKPFEDLPSGPTFYKRELDFIKENGSKHGYNYNDGIQTGTFKLE